MDEASCISVCAHASEKISDPSVLPQAMGKSLVSLGWLGRVNPKAFYLFYFIWMELMLGKNKSFLLKLWPKCFPLGTLKRTGASGCVMVNKLD